MKLLMPLRVPELAPSLGRIIVPRRQKEPWVPLDDIREELATRVLELGGEGRAAAAREADGNGGADQRARVLETTSRRAWTAAWDHAVRRAGARIADALDAELTRTAQRVRVPRRRLRRLLLTTGEKRAIVARLGTCGGTFVAALDELETAATRAGDASVLEKDAHAAWQEALRTVARGSRRHGSHWKMKWKRSTNAGSPRSTRSPRGAPSSGRCCSPGSRLASCCCGSAW
jgi:hypothetical protein